MGTNKKWICLRNVSSAPVTQPMASSPGDWSTRRSNWQSEPCILFTWVNVSWKVNNQNKGGQTGGLFKGVSQCISLWVRTHSRGDLGRRGVPGPPAARTATQALVSSGQKSLCTDTAFHTHLHERGQGSQTAGQNLRGNFSIGLPTPHFHKQSLPAPPFWLTLFFNKITVKSWN